MFSPTFWADLWATYSLYDGYYADRRTFGFNADIGNGFFTPIPTLILYATFTINFLPAVGAGILGVMLFWQWTYVTSVYWVSFFVANRHSRDDMYTYIWAVNSPWVIVRDTGVVPIHSLGCRWQLWCVGPLMTPEAHKLCCRRHPVRASDEHWPSGVNLQRDSPRL